MKELKFIDNFLNLGDELTKELREPKKIKQEKVNFTPKYHKRNFSKMRRSMGMR